MSEALVSFLVEQLGSIIFQQVGQNVRLVVNVKNEVGKLIRNLKTIQAVLADAERGQVKEANVRRWLNDLKEVSYEIEDVVDEWSTKILKQQIKKQGENVVVPNKKVCFCIPCHFLCNGQVTQITFRRNIAVWIEELNKRLALILKQRKFYEIPKFEQLERLKSVSMVRESETFGREYEREMLVSQLVSENSEEREMLVSQLVSENSEERKRPLVISIVGMAGIGKTTLAQLAYNDAKVKKCFDTRIWVCVSEPFVQIAVAKAILEGLNVSVPNSNELETFVQRISDSIEGKKFLLVLDDVWDSNHGKWQFLATLCDSGALGSRILVTTRIVEVASVMGTTNDHIMYIEELGEDSCRSLFYHTCFDNKGKESPKFEDIGNEIVKWCKGLPLAAKTLGNLMRPRNTVQQWAHVLNGKICELEVVENEVFQSLLLSYHDLEPESKRCLLYCATFPKDHTIVKDQLIELWMSQEYLEVKGGNKEQRIVGEMYFECLVKRSFFQEIERDFEGNIRSCKMHGIVHDFVQYLTKDECLSMVVKSAKRRMELRDNEIRHLSLMFAPKGPFTADSFLNCTSLRTLTAFESKLTSIGVELISQSKSLRTLNLSKNSITEVSQEIGGLIHLRYLDLSHNRELKELPDSLCNLYNLQTLRLVGCNELVKFPNEEGMRNLTKLKHLYVDWCCRLKSKGIGRLTGLQKLDMFHLNGYNAADREGTLKLQDLKNLKQLEGSLKIAHLESLEDASEGLNACLSEKHLLHHLFLDFLCSHGCEKQIREEGTGQNDWKILKGLKPHKDLKSLIIWNYQATSPCPDWILSLCNLTSLELGFLGNCEQLSGPFGKLQSLESLAFRGMGKVKKVGVEFLGIDETELQSSSSSSTLILFPKLKRLEFWGMEEWDEWEGVGGDFQKNIIIMPSLSHLRFTECPKLGKLPDFLRKTPLQSVTVVNSPVQNK